MGLSKMRKTCLSLLYLIEHSGRMILCNIAPDNVRISRNANELEMRFKELGEKMYLGRKIYFSTNSTEDVKKLLESGNMMCCCRKESFEKLEKIREIDTMNLLGFLRLLLSGEMEIVVFQDKNNQRLKNPTSMREFDILSINDKISIFVDTLRKIKSILMIFFLLLVEPILPSV